MHRDSACGVRDGGACAGERRDVLQGTRGEPGEHFGDGRRESVVVDAV